MLTNLSGGKAVEGGCTTFFQEPKFLCFYDLRFEKLMGGSLGGEHSSHMFIIFLNQIVGLELAPPVQRGSSWPVLYVN